MICKCKTLTKFCKVKPTEEEIKRSCFATCNEPRWTRCVWWLSIWKHFLTKDKDRIDIGWTDSSFQERNRRQLGGRFEGDIILSSSGSSGSKPFLGAHIADPDRLWPNGIVEYKFRRTLPRCFAMCPINQSIKYISGLLQTIHRGYCWITMVNRCSSSPF